MKLSNLFLFVLLFPISLLQAQTDFRPGYIIIITGDTLYGDIDYRGDLLMSQLCKFKDKGSIIKDYLPNDIAAFRFVDSKYYVSRDVNGRRVFLEYLIKGKVNIYYLRDKNGDHYYLEKEDVKLTEIPYNEGTKYVDDKRVFFETTKHIGLLNYYMRDAPELQTQVQAMKKPDHQNLIKLAEDYHNAICDDEKCIIYEKKVPSIKISFTPFLGLTNYNGYDKLVNEFGGYLYIWAPRVSEKLFFKTGFAFNKLSIEGKNFDVLKIPVQFQYIYRAHKLQPHISCGVNFLGLKLEDYKDITNTLSVNAGLNYKLSNKVSICTAFNSDYIPLFRVITDDDLSFDIISYSVIIGLRVDL